MELFFFVYITYSNVYSYNLNNLEYTISVTKVDNTKFKAIQPINSKDITSRSLWNRHGIRIIVIQTGTISKFDFQTLLLTFISGLGLITIATTIVDILATKILPGRDIYSFHKYQDTENIQQSFLKKKEYEKI